MVPWKLGWVAIQEQLSQNGEKIVLEADSGICFQNYKIISMIKNYTLVHSREERESFQWAAKVKLLIDSTSALPFTLIPNLV